MFRSLKLRALLVVFLVFAIVPATGCDNALETEDWQRDLLNLGLSSGIAVITNIIAPWFQTRNVVVERNCFENGVPVDCSQLPNAGAI